MNRRKFQQGFKGQQMRGKNSFAIIFLAFTFSILSGLTQAQTLGVYAFTGSNGCNYTSITSQPSNATFSSYSSVNTNCESASNVYSRDAWNTSSTINTSEYNEFTITPNTGYVLNLTNLTFTQYMSYNNSTTWALRSSVDNYASNISTGTATTTSQTPSVTLTGFTNLGATTFRLYILNANSSLTDWTNDNVTLSGTVTSTCTTPAAPGNPTSNSPQCATPGVTLTKSGSAPSGVTWYWQGTNSAGTSTASNATSTYNATISGTYYIRAQDNAGLCWSASSGSIAVTVNQLPTITLGSNPSVCIGTTTANLTYSATTDSPDKYSIDYDATAEAAGFTDIADATLPSSPIVLTMSASATTGTYNYTVTVKNNTTSCISAGTAKTITLGAPTTVTPGDPLTALQSASPTAITLSGASVGGSATTGAWSITSGGGTLSSTSQTSSPQTVTYTPAANYSGTVVLTLTTNSVICPASSGNRTISVDPASTQTFYSTSTITIPSGITSVNVECWGGGGAGGGDATSADGGGGGGGGAFSAGTISVTAGTTYTVTVGDGGLGVTNSNGNAGGDSWFGSSSTIMAKGGSGGHAPVSGAAGIKGVGGAAASGIGTVKYSGGDGGDGNDNTNGYGGGGGSSAGTAANGNVGGTAVSSYGLGATAPTGGGNGGNGANNSNGAVGSVPGGGGGGSGDQSNTKGGDGGKGKVIVSWSSTLVLSGNARSAADVYANATNVPIHSFSLQGENSSLTDVNFVTTGNYASAEITNFKLYYTTTNTFSTANLLATISSPTTAGTQTFPAFSSLSFTGASKYFWITMDIATSVTDGHTIAVNGTSASNLTASMTATGSAAASGTQTLKPAAITLTSAAGTNNQTVCNTTAITSITYTIAACGTGASVTGLPDGVTGSYNSSTVTISGTPSVAGNYNYTVTANGTCVPNFVIGVITVNPLPTITLGSNPVVCSGTTTANLTYSATTDSPDKYSIDYDAAAEAQGFTDVSNATLPSSPITLTVPSGAAAGTYNYTVTVKNNTTGCTSTGTAKTVTINSLPTITLGGNSSVCAGTTTANLSYSATTQSPDQYSLDYDAIAEAAGFTDIVNASLPASPIALTVPYGAAASTYNYTVTVKNTSTGCSSTATSKTITVDPIPTITLGSNPSLCIGTTTADLTYSATTQSPDVYSVNFDATAETAGFIDIVDATLPTNPIVLNISPTATADTYNYTVTVKNNTTGCTSAGTAKTITLGAPATVNPGDPLTVLQSASPTPITLSGASVGGSATTGAWSITSGGGTLSSTSQTSSPETVTYTPAANYSGTVVLTLTTNSVICGAVSATRTISIDPSTTQTFYTTATFTIPSCITSVNVECWGGGGAGGGDATASDGGGGGGGGAFSAGTITVTPGTTYTVTVGDGGLGVTNSNGNAGGDSWFGSASTIMAKGGSGGHAPVSGAAGLKGEGGAAASGVGTIKYSGGDGGDGNDYSNGWGGGGGSSAGTAANGNAGGTATNSTYGAGATAPAGGGNGGNGTNNSNGMAGSVPGGGGGGSGDKSSTKGGNGGKGKVMLSWSSALVIGSNAQLAADVYANTTNKPIHSFSLQGDNSCITGLSFITTGNYASAEISNFKLYYTTTNTFSTSNLIATISSPTTAGTQSFPAFTSLAFTNSTNYFWITMDVANTVTDGHTITVSGTSASNLTASMTATGSANASGTQTLKSNATISLTSGAETDDQTVCNNTVITNITYSVGGCGSGASVSGLPDGITSAYNSGTVTISGTPNVAGTFNYTVTTTGSNCIPATAIGSMIVNPLPTITVSDPSPICTGGSAILTAGGATTYFWSPSTGLNISSGASVIATLSQTTIYTVTGTAANGCSNTNTITVTLNSNCSTVCVESD